MWRRRAAGRARRRRLRRPPLFADDPTRQRSLDDTGERRLSFGPDDTGPLPHWTEPPTGEMPRMAPAASSDDDTSDDDLDVWSSFTDRVARSGATTSGRPDRRARPTHRSTGEVRRRARCRSRCTTSRPATIPIARAATRARPHHHRHRPTDDRPGAAPAGLADRRGAAAARRRSGRPAASRPRDHGRRRPPPPRDMPTAVAVGARSSPASSSSLTLLASPSGDRPDHHRRRRRPGVVEFFDKVTEKGYRPATVAGIVACVAAPLAAYWVGERGAAAGHGASRSSPAPSASSRRRASSPARCRTWRSPRSASCGSACSARSPR